MERREQIFQEALQRRQSELHGERRLTRAGKASGWVSKLGAATWFDLAPDGKRQAVAMPVDTPEAPKPGARRDLRVQLHRRSARARAGGEIALSLARSWLFIRSGRQVQSDPLVIPSLRATARDSRRTRRRMASNGAIGSPKVQLGMTALTSHIASKSAPSGFTQWDFVISQNRKLRGSSVIRSSGLRVPAVR